MTDHALAPVRPQDRIATLDLLRGLGVLGILAVNAISFAAPPAAYFNPALWPFPNEGLSEQIGWAVNVFFQGKFVTLFTMLFGVSVFLVGGEREDDDRGRVLRRRLFWLLLIGVLHGSLIWYGDILTLYALVGFVFLLMRSFSARRLLVVGIAMLVAGGLVGVGFTAMGQWALAAGKIPAEQMTGAGPIPTDPASFAAALEAYRSGWSGALAQNFRDWTSFVWIMPIIFGWTTLALMATGLGLFKAGFLKGRAPAAAYLAAIAAGGAALAYTASVAPSPSEPLNIFSLPVAISAALTPLVTLAYASALILAAKAAGGLLRPLAAVGQMAFTNYLTQSLVMTSIFFGGRGGMIGTVDRPELALIVLGVWALQLVWSPLWLSVFAMGPLEWVWRCLTYGRLVPITRARAGATVAA
jgi:uncharacterized protein